MNLRERKPLQSPCALVTPEDPNYKYEGPFDEAYISGAETPKIRLNKAKDGDNRQSAKLQKRLNTLGDADHCNITFQQNFCGLIERCHGLERSDSWAKPEMLHFKDPRDPLCEFAVETLQYYLGYEKPGMLNLDTRRNFWRGAVNLHRLGDNGAFAFLNSLEVLKVVRDYTKEVRALGQDIDRRRFYEEVLQVLQSPDGTFPYEMLPILMDECYPIAQKPGQSIDPGADTTHVSFHVHPFTTIGVLDLHLSPPFAIMDAWDKITTHGRKKFWTDSQRRPAESQESEKESSCWCATSRFSSAGIPDAVSY
ncbi:hypothetical protein CPB85DRAFT_1440610 [Mucidula mucida]|nr:hypothetical protein CPB85DRAFT_1440610 [Mucidula mucida]